MIYCEEFRILNGVDFRAWNNHLFETFGYISILEKILLE